MVHPDINEYLKLAKTANVIPVYKEIVADLDTPVSSYLKINKNQYSFLLESVEGQEKIARYSFLGSNPSLVFISKGKEISIIKPFEKVIKKFITKTDPLDEIKKIIGEFKPVQLKGLPRFFGGFVGFIGYDMVRFFEDIPDKNTDPLKTPDSVLMLTDTILIFDHVKHSIKIVSNILLDKKGGKISRRKLFNCYQEAVKKIKAIETDFSKQLNAPLDIEEKDLNLTIESNFSKKEFCDRVKQAKEYIRKGDIIQVVLSQRFNTSVKNNPFNVYRRLRSINPSPYMFFLNLNDTAFVGSSPEMLVRCEERLVQTRPIAGTRKRGSSDEEDVLLEKELLSDQKEKAEHIMLVDLGRNDLGRVCEPGKVIVKEFMNVERYSHVMHIVSVVEGILKKKYDSYSVLRACFPAGTVSGSPKIRAMEIIDELENLKRGSYAGCVGYFSFSGNMDTCITIRTIIVKEGRAYIQAGAGIVADSVPLNEYYESVSKAKALFSAIAGKEAKLKFLNK